MTNQTVIFDLDGTLVNNADVSFDPLLTRSTHRYPTIPLLMEFIDAKRLGYKVVVLTCRSALWRWRTMKWLKRFGLEPDALYMRPPLSFRDDVKVKLELLMHASHDGYKPVLAFEDNHEVADHYRGLGIETVDPKTLVELESNDGPVEWKGLTMKDQT